MCDDEVAALVVDNGSGMCKVSFIALSQIEPYSVLNSSVLTLEKDFDFVKPEDWVRTGLNRNKLVV